MSPPDSAAAHGGRVRTLLASGVLLACLAGGFLVYRLTHTPPSLRVAAPAPAAALPAAGTPTAAPTAAASAAEPKIPEALPDIALPGLDGKPRRLGQWKGHPLLVNFWASWCEPCRREIPLLKALRRENAANGLEIVGIAIDFQDAAQKYARESHIDYPVLVGEEGGYEAVAAFGMEPVLPFTVFADAQGRIVSLKVGELHRDEAELILGCLEGLREGRLSLAQARTRIAQGVRRLGAARAADAAAH